LLAIIIGLVVTIVAGVLLAQLYFGYAATISTRPAANIEYVDLVENGANDVLVIDVKNTGNVRIVGYSFQTEPGTCTPTPSQFQIPPGGTGSITCSGQIVGGPGQTWSGSITIQFDVNGDGTADSYQVYAISVRARSA